MCCFKIKSRLKKTGVLQKNQNKRISKYFGGFGLGFPRDGTSYGRSQDNPRQDVPLSLCPGTKKFCLSWCPFVPGQGQEQMSRDKLLCPGTSRDKMNEQISCFRTSFSCLRTTFSVLEHHLPVLEHPFLLCPVLSRVPSRILAVPARPVPNFGCPGPSRPLVRFLARPVVPLSRDKEKTSVPLSRKVALSRPVGNPSSDGLHMYLLWNWRFYS